jgi:hypothetical protein
MHAINTDLLRRLRRAARQTTAASAGLMQQLVEAERFRTSAAGRLAAAQTRLQAWPDGQPLPGEDDRTWADRQNQQEVWRANQRDAARQHFGAQAAQVIEENAAQFGRPSQLDYYAAVEAAGKMVAKADEEIASITTLQQETGTLAGELNLTVQIAERWMVENGFAAELTQ